MATSAAGVVLSDDTTEPLTAEVETPPPISRTTEWRWREVTGETRPRKVYTYKVCGQLMSGEDDDIQWLHRLSVPWAMVLPKYTQTVTD